ncbi:MAG TPA: FAD-dependent oxidoreductase [Chitinophagaceae bacterium]|nr:FAD-dependent oxidoreductase [Chitinophagaceae bacterium]
MKHKNYLLFFLGLYCTFLQGYTQSVTEVDVCVYGGTSAGVIAAYTAKKSGKSVILIEPGKHLGGLTTGGLGYTDIGNKYAITGVSRNFYRRVGKHYGSFEQWIFEPHVAEDVYAGYVKEAGLDVLYQYQLANAKKNNGYIKEITLEPVVSSPGNSPRVVAARMFIDCSYEGDLMAKAGVSYIVGREANSLYNETYNGIQLRDKHQFPDGVDPYKVPGKPESGLVWGISPEPLGKIGDGDNKVQAYNFRICLTDQPANMIPITRPDDYDSAKYELLLRALEKKPAKDLWSYLKFDLMPNHKTDINNNGPFSTDMIGMNYEYPEASYAERNSFFKKQESYTKGFLYFIGHDQRMPAHLRTEFLKWGYPKDEYTDNGGWSPQMYVREARRMKGEYVMTQANCEGKEIVPDEVGMAAYTMDSHNIQRIVHNGMVKNEGDVQVGGFGPYPIAYRSLIPKSSECKNLLVPVCLSASHIAYGSIRMEPVFMVLAQSSAVAACLAIDEKTSVQEVNIKNLQKILKTNPLANGKTPEILVDNDDKAHTTVRGSWASQKQGGYGPGYFADTSRAKQIKSVRFTPDVLVKGVYKVYTYFPKLQHGSSTTNITVFDGKKPVEKSIEKANIQVQGQTSGEWVSLGSYTLYPGKKAYVEITNKGADNTIVADAVLFVPENN